MSDFDIIVIGAGIAGLSAAYELSKTRKILVLEQEAQPGYHATGRSAAVYAACYGSEQTALYSLVRSSWDFFQNPPEDFSEYALYQDRGIMFIADQDHVAELKEHYAEIIERNPDSRWIEGTEIKSRFPLLKETYCKAAIYDPHVYDLDVSALQEGYLRGIGKAGGQIICDYQVSSLHRKDNIWTVSNGQENYSAPIIVNAAGAWVDKIAGLASVPKIAIQPLRRSAILVDGPAELDRKIPANWPMLVEFREEFFFKPDAGKLLASPANEDLSEPCDAQPEELDIAYAAHYVGEALDMGVDRIDHSWAGLRSFVADRGPVIGFDHHVKGFFWVAGQGGYGIQTAPAAGRLVAALISGKDVPEDMASYGLTEALTSPARLSRQKDDH